MSGEHMAKKVKKILVGSFSGVALIMLIVVAIILVRKNVVKSDFEEVPAVVTDTWNGKYSHTTVEYEYEGESYNRKLDVYSSTYYVGKEINVYINPQKPGNPEIMLGYNIGIMVVSILGAAFLIVALCILIFFGKKGKKLEKLRVSGRRVFAKIESIDVNWNVSVMNRHPFYIICSWKNNADGKIYHFRSQNLWDDPRYAIEKMNIESLTVYIDERNIRKYAVDVEPLLSEKNGVNHVYL